MFRGRGLGLGRSGVYWWEKGFGGRTILAGGRGKWGTGRAEGLCSGRGGANLFVAGGVRQPKQKYWWMGALAGKCRRALRQDGWIAGMPRA